MVSFCLRRCRAGILSPPCLALSSAPPPTRLELLGVHLRRRGTFFGDRGILQAHRLRGGAGVRHDRDRLIDQPQSSLPRCPGVRRQNPAGARIPSRRRWRDPRPRGECFFGLLGKGRAAGRYRGKRWLAAHRRSGGTRRRRQSLLSWPQEKRHRHSRRPERLSRGPRSRSPPPARHSRCGRHPPTNRRQRRALRHPALWHRHS